MNVELFPHDLCKLQPQKLYKNVQEPFEEKEQCDSVKTGVNCGIFLEAFFHEIIFKKKSNEIFAIFRLVANSDFTRKGIEGPKSYRDKIRKL